MKTKNIKNLKLNKKSVSNLDENIFDRLKGGVAVTAWGCHTGPGGFPSCQCAHH